MEQIHLGQGRVTIPAADSQSKDGIRSFFQSLKPGCSSHPLRMIRGASGKPCHRVEPQEPALPPLADALVKADAGGDGNVQALNFAGHGDAGEEVALLAGETPHPGTFGTHHHADRAFEVNVV